MGIQPTPKNTVVMKFGGTSVGSVERIDKVAERVIEQIKSEGRFVVVVVSAMSGETDRLINLGRAVSGGSMPPREYNHLATAGEQVSSALVAMALLRKGQEARSLLAHQLQLCTREFYGQNLISQINVDHLRSMLIDGIVPVVAGFQGIDEKGDLTTLGRGGSDTTAVALAAALGSCDCHIYTDVDGVYTTVPSVCRNAKKLPYLSFEEMLELASGGAKVLHTRSVSLAYRYRVPLLVCSSFEHVDGTRIVEEYPGMENSVVSGITFKTGEARITIRDMPDKPGTAAELFHKISELGVIVDMIVQSRGQDGKAEISFTIPEESADTTLRGIEDLIARGMQGARLELDRSIAKISVVGEGMRTHAGTASQMFEVLSREGINIELITTSEVKISVAINQKYVELAVRALHEHFIEAKDKQD